jgi:hypothetical protein
MITTQDETGVWNNYASEPPVYFATYPSPEKQRQYWTFAGFSILLISSLMMVALAAS